MQINKTEVLIIIPAEISDRIELDLDVEYTVDEKHLLDYKIYIEHLEKYEFKYATYSSMPKNQMINYVNEIVNDWPNISYIVYIVTDFMTYNKKYIPIGNSGKYEFISELNKHNIPLMPLIMHRDDIFDNELSIRGNYKESLELITSIPKVLYTNGNLILPEKEIWFMDVENELTKYLSRNVNKLYSFSSREFERLIASILVSYGFEVELTPETRDGGFDILAIRNDKITGNETILIECKKYAPNNKVGIGVVQRLIGAVNQFNANKGILVTTSMFTKDASKSAELSANKVILKDLNNIADWIKNIK